MLNFIQRLLAGPEFDDEDQTRAARLLNVIFILALILNTLNLAGLMRLDLASIDLGINVVLTGVLLAMLMLLWRGYVNSMSLIFCVLVAGLANVLAYTNQGILSPIYVGNVCAIIASGLLLGGWAAVLFTLVSLLTGMIFLLTARYGIHPDTIGLSTAGLAFIDYSVIFIFVCLISWISGTAVKNALLRARRNEQAQIEQNQALQREIHDRQQIETALRATEAALRESEQRFRVALASAPIRVANLDRDLRYTWVYNSQWFESDHLIGKTDSDILTPASAARVMKLKQSVLDTGIGLREEVEVEVQGQIRYIDITIEPLRDASGQIIGITSASFNVTDQKHAQQERFKSALLHVEVEKNKRLAQLKDSFVTMVLHEFRTPLTIINTSQELLDRYHERMTDEHRHNHLTQIGAQVQHMVDMLDDILTLSKASAGMIDFHPAAVNLKQFSQGIVNDFHELYPNNPLRFTCSRSSDRKALADASLLRAALLKVLSNAVKYSAPGSAIDFEAICHVDEAIFRVTDHGIGIPTEDHARLFEPFHRASNVSDIGGTGLGLAIAKSTLDAHRATIEFVSQEGVGTTFTIRLPLRGSSSFPVLKR